MAEPLPYQPPPQVSTPSFLRAYHLCLQLEQNVGRTLATRKPPPAISARILGYLLIHAPTQEGRVILATEIESCENYDDGTRMPVHARNVSLCEIGALYFHSFICCFRSNPGPLPGPSEHPSRPSFDNMAQMLTWVRSQRTSGHSRKKEEALIRDGFKCMVTGGFDMRYLRKNPSISQQLRDEGKLFLGHRREFCTQAAHILPQSIMPTTTVPDEPDQAGQCWAIMERLGAVSYVHQQLNGNDIHDLSNMLTLSTSIHQAFDDLQLWFVPHPDGTANKYEVVLDPSMQDPSTNIPESVEWHTDHPEYPLPDPKFLALHAACCVVARLSGAAEYIEQLLDAREKDDVPVLASDGSMAEELRLRLTLRHIPPV